MTPALAPPSEHGMHSSREGPVFFGESSHVPPSQALPTYGTLQPSVLFPIMLVTTGTACWYQLLVLARGQPVSRNRRKPFPIFKENPGSNETLQRKLLHFDSSNKPVRNAFRTELAPRCDLLSVNLEDAQAFSRSQSGSNCCS